MTDVEKLIEIINYREKVVCGGHEIVEIFEWGWYHLDACLQKQVVSVQQDWLRTMRHINDANRHLWDLTCKDKRHNTAEQNSIYGLGNEREICSRFWSRSYCKSKWNYCAHVDAKKIVARKIQSSKSMYTNFKLKINWCCYYINHSQQMLVKR